MTTPSEGEAMLALAKDCELYAKVVDGIIVVADDWQPGGPERREPRETLLKAAAFLRAAALPPAPMPERNGMRALADRLDCYAYNFDVDHAEHVIADLRSAAKALRAALAPHDKIADSSGPNPGAIGASKEAGGLADIATVAPASTVSRAERNTP